MKAYKLIANPKNWQQCGGNREGGPCCLVVAVYRCYPSAWDSKLNIIRDHLGVRRLGDWNDALERTHSEVVNVLKELDI